MEKDEIKRLKRLVFRCFLFSLALIVVAVFAVSFQLRRLNSQLVASKSTVIKETVIVRDKPLQGEHGINGTNGVSIKGDQGNSVRGDKGDSIIGENGLNVTADQIAQAVTSYLQAHPPASGLKGDTGAAGLAVFVQQNPVTSVLECRRGTDTIWQPISECSQ
jgi:hypothetical protein